MAEKSIKNQVNAITEGVIWKQLLLFFFPILLGTFFQQMYNTVDTIVVGRFVGTDALAAVGASGPLINLFIGFFVGLSSGATVILSQRYGAQDDEGVSQAVHTGTALALVGGVIITALGLVTTPWVLRIIGTPENVFGDAVMYTCIYFSGTLASVLYNMGSGILRALGDSKRPMVYLIICCVANIVLDLLFVVGFKMGVAGAGWATVLSQVISAVLVLSAMMRMEGPSRLIIKKIRFERTTLKGIIRIGIPAGLQSVMYNVSNLIIQSGINSFGSVTMAAWTAHGKMDAVVWMISGAFAVAITTFVGQNFGAQKYDRVRKSVRVCLTMSIVSIGLLSVLLITFSRYLLGIFSGDAAVIQEGIKIVSYITPFYVLYMPIEIFSGTMRGTGDSLIPTLITCVGVCVLRVLWVVLVVSRWHTVLMLALAYAVTWGITSIVFTVYYLQGGWLHKRIEALSMRPEERPSRRRARKA